MSDGVIEPSRTSTLNRTMVISKKTVRPVLPQVGQNQEAVHELDLPEESHELSPDGSLTTRRKRTSTVTLQSDIMEQFSGVFDESEISEIQKLSELKRKILTLVDSREKQWNAKSPNSTEFAALKLQTEVAKRAALYADKFFAICERNEIDIEKVLRQDPDMLYSMRLQSNILTPSSQAEQEKEVQGLKAEKENLAEETKALKASYSNLFKSYERLRSNYDLMREARNSLAEQVEKQREAMHAMYSTAVNFKGVMLEHASIADQTVAETKGKYDSDTVTIRMNLVKLENENNSLKSEVDSKNNEIVELRRIVHEIVKQVNLEALT